MLRLSIIIPTYNLESFIGVTLDSCLRQNIPSDEYEIICVNDGSTDKSAEVISKYAEKHPNVKLISQTYAGVSTARNKGIDLAQGRYIWFVDGDDMISDNCLKDLLYVVESNNLDIFNIEMQSVSTRDFFNAQMGESIICPDGEDKLLFMTSKGGTGGGVCISIFKTDLLKNNSLRFSENIKYSEDVLFAFKALIKAERCAKTDSVFYHYYQREGSAMHSSNHIKHIESMYLLAGEYLKIADEEEKWRSVSLSKKDFAIKALLFGLVQNADVKLAKEWIVKLRSEKLYPFPLLWGSLKNNATLKQVLINYLSFLFPWRWYFMTCVRLVALKNNLRRKNK